MIMLSEGLQIDWGYRHKLDFMSQELGYHWQCGLVPVTVMLNLIPDLYNGETTVHFTWLMIK